MKPTPITLTGVQLTAEEFVAVNFRLWRTRPRTRLNHWILGAAVGLLGLSVGLDIYQHGQLSQPSTLVFLVVAVLYAVFRAGLARYQLRRGYARNATLQQPVDFTLTDTELVTHTVGGQFSANWSLIRRAVWVQPHWLLLYPSEAACYYLDMRRLQAPATAADVAALLERLQISQQHQ
ncbi:hypothetical protein [Hymenobacter metallilatus]|uniref:YcxB family protein n=1 Tax=Hymenobacter metallilatus TaxID=2493666 RepID=A0A3R9M416_9BACT|nr:hypothetical protein [Hymenobacter metallilatus]RSK36183.1 hypothetical protein EI290_04670 [Hymenobacter metallilatus]